MPAAGPTLLTVLPAVVLAQKTPYVPGETRLGPPEHLGTVLLLLFIGVLLVMAVPVVAAVWTARRILRLRRRRTEG